MANQPEQVQYDAGIYQLETTDPVDGGVGAVSNKPLLNLANRTAYLKTHVDTLEAGTGALAPINSPTFTGTPAAPTAPFGDSTTKLATDAFVQGTVNGISTINVAGGANVTLTTVQAGQGTLVFTGLLTANISVIVPVTAAKWEISNQTTGAFTLRVKTASGTGILVGQGKNTVLWCDGTNVLDGKTDFLDTSLTGNPTAPTAASGDHSPSVANTNFVFNSTDGMSTVIVAGNTDVTLTQAQYGAAILNMSGALTGNINLNFPSQTGQWIVANNSSGAFAITGKVSGSGGATVVLPQGSAVIVYSDGLNMGLASSVGNQASFTRTPFSPTAGTTVLTVGTGYTPGNLLIEKNGAILEPADFTATNGSTITLTKASVTGDVFNVYAFKTFTVPNAVLRSGDTMAGPLLLFGGDTGTTAAQFDNSTKLATTAYVMDAIGSLSGFIQPTANTVLTAANIGQLVWCGGTGPYTITLPSSVGLPPGSVIHMHCTAGTAGPVTITTQGSDLVHPGNGVGITSFTMSVGDDCDLICVAPNVWIPQSGSISLRYNQGAFGNSIVASANGYQKLPSGLIIQWLSLTAGSGGHVSGLWPIAFPNAVLLFVGNAGAGATSASTVTAFTQGSATSNTTCDGWAASGASGLACKIIAIGF